MPASNVPWEWSRLSQEKRNAALAAMMRLMAGETREATRQRLEALGLSGETAEWAMAEFLGESTPSRRQPNVAAAQAFDRLLVTLIALGVGLIWLVATWSLLPDDTLGFAFSVLPPAALSLSLAIGVLRALRAFLRTLRRKE